MKSAVNAYLLKWLLPLAFLLLPVILPGQSAPLPAQEYTIKTIENRQLRVAFDTTSGALVSMENKVTGWGINRQEPGLSFQMLVPVPGKRDNQVYGNRQKLSGFHISPDGNTLTFVWNRLAGEFSGPLDITFIATVAIDEYGLSFQAKIENHSPYTVEAVNYPMLSDLSPPSGGDSFKVMSKNYSGLENTELMPHFTNGKGYWGTMNPTLGLVRQYILIGNDKQGLYVGNHDAGQKTMVEYYFRLLPGYESSALNLVPREDLISGLPVHIEFSPVHFPFVKPGETSILSPIVFQAYQGDWTYGVDRYKEWRKTWHTEPYTATWVKDIHSWQQIRVYSSEDHVTCSYKELVQYGEECARNDVAAIQITGWEKGGQDRGDPSHDTDPVLGTWQDLHDAIQAIQNKGVKVILFTKFLWGDRSSGWYRKELQKYAARDPYGDPYLYGGYAYDTQTQLSDINTRRYSPMCMSSAAYRSIAAKEFEKVVKLGASGMLYDENGHHGPARFCFDSTHGHPVPAYIFEGDMKLAQEFRDISDQYDKKFLFAGESFGTNPLSNYYNLSYTRFGDSYTPLERYEDPYMPLMVAVFGFDDREMLNLCLMYRYIISYEPYHFKGHLNDFPLTLEYGKRIDSLRKRYREYLWDAEFISQREASVLSDSVPYQKYSVFKNPVTGQRAVVIANHSINNAITVKILIDNSIVPLFSASPENPDLRILNSPMVTIPARSVIVVLEK